MTTPDDVPADRLGQVRDALRRSVQQAIERHLEGATESLIGATRAVNSKLAAEFYGEARDLEPPARERRLVHTIVGGAALIFATGLTGGMAAVPWAVGAAALGAGYLNGALGPAHRLWALRTSPEGLFDAIRHRHDPRLRDPDHIDNSQHTETAATEEVDRLQVGLIGAITSTRLSAMVFTMAGVASAVMGVYLAPTMVGLQSAFVATAAAMAGAAASHFRGADRLSRARDSVQRECGEVVRRARVVEEWLDADRAFRTEREVAPAIVCRDPWVKVALRDYQRVATTSSPNHDERGESGRGPDGFTIS